MIFSVTLRSGIAEDSKQETQLQGPEELLLPRTGHFSLQ